MANEEPEGTSAVKESEDTERTGLAERERQDQEKAKVNRDRQLRQGHVSDEPKEEPKEEPQKAAPKAKSK